MENYKSKHYIIIGATGGIGSLLSKQLKDFGASLSLVARHEDQLKSLAAELNSDYYSVDVINFTETEKLFEQIEKKYGQIAGVVNCAGSMLIKPAHLTSEAEFDEQINENLKTAFSVARASGKFMSNYGGSVVLMSSSVADVGIYNHEAISAAKGGVNSLVRSVASSYASNNLRFNAVALGLVETPMTEELTSSPMATEVSKSMHPLERIGKPNDATSMILWLLDPSNDWVTGQVYSVDGGLSSVRPKIKL